MWRCRRRNASWRQKGAELRSHRSASGYGEAARAEPRFVGRRRLPRRRLSVGSARSGHALHRTCRDQQPRRTRWVVHRRVPFRVPPEPSRPTRSTHSSRDARGTVTRCDVPGGVESRADGINNRGKAAGTYIDAGTTLNRTAHCRPTWSTDSCATGAAGSPRSTSRSATCTPFAISTTATGSPRTAPSRRTRCTASCSTRQVPDPGRPRIVADPGIRHQRPRRRPRPGARGRFHTGSHSVTRRAVHDRERCRHPSHRAGSAERGTR
jgi:hypothetical protein